ncbi:MAG TPA: Gfo/Idh/MocA family oxidoreductase [Clostridiales bacterium]|nr:Gfo/Idh/MocA family oxidoreductase [Clostridiales bacterium]
MEQKQIGIGIIGCGNISDIYLTNLTRNFKNVEVKACADMFLEKAEQQKERYGLAKACTVEELLADPELEIVVNLTIPAAHHSVNLQALKAGKHVYCEKPLALNLEDAEEAANVAKEKGLILCSAPDTFLGAGLQTCRKLLDEGAIGKALGFTANLVGPGHEMWHPAPEFYYKKGGGPMLDMGPYYITALVALLGPIKQLSCFAKTSRQERSIKGEMVEVEVPTHYAGIVEFESGLIGNVNMSFDVWESELPQLEIYGTEGVMHVPDPNMFGGPVKLYDGKKMERIVTAVEGVPINRLMKMHGCKAECLREVELAFPAEAVPRSNLRGFGVADMAQALLDKRSSRLNAELSKHVVEALTAFDISSRENRVYKMRTTCERPAPMSLGLELWQMD